MKNMASEIEAESACKDLRQIIEAAENSNQAGENAAVIAADGSRLRRAILKYAESGGFYGKHFQVVHELRWIVGEKHKHRGPNDQCGLCLRNFRDSVHHGEGFVIKQEQDNKRLR